MNVTVMIATFFCVLGLVQGYLILWHGQLGCILPCIFALAFGITGFRIDGARTRMESKLPDWMRDDDER